MATNAITAEGNAADPGATHSREKILVICPGRGTYGQQELGYLYRWHRDKAPLIAALDDYRRAAGQPTLTALDGRPRFAVNEHTRGDNASALIFACAYSDYLSIDRQRYEVVAITGNSMGWYIALACAGALGPEQAMRVINTMGTLMQDNLIGGQLIYPLVDENWQTIAGRRAWLQTVMDDINRRPDCRLYTSIELGGMLVLAGNAAALTELAKHLPHEQGRFPLLLHNHAAFHTPLQRPVAEIARVKLGHALFQPPSIPLIDGRGQVWTPYASDPEAIWNYTLGDQVCDYYDFSRAIAVSVKEYAPDKLVLLGPGSTLGGAVAQSLIAIGWQGLSGKQDFIARQQQQPLLLSMGMAAQRQAVCGNTE